MAIDSGQIQQAVGGNHHLYPADAILQDNGFGGTGVAQMLLVPTGFVGMLRSGGNGVLNILAAQQALYRCRYWHGWLLKLYHKGRGPFPLLESVCCAGAGIPDSGSWTTLALTIADLCGAANGGAGLCIPVPTILEGFDQYSGS